LDKKCNFKCRKTGKNSFLVAKVERSFNNIKNHSDMNKALFIPILAVLPVLAQEDMPRAKDIPVPAPGMEQPRYWGAAGEMPGRRGRKDFHKKMLEKFDVDKDGRLSDAEKEAMKADMQKRRAEGENRPGVRGDRAPKGPRAKRPEGMQRPSREDMHKKMLEKFDADKDGCLSDAEKEAMKAAAAQRRAERMPRHPRPEGMEHPGNRRRPHSERPEMIQKYDTDKDGQLSPEEHAALRADAQKARRGTNEKVEKFHKQFMEKFDTDKDGKLSDAEKEAAEAAHGVQRRQRKSHGKRHKMPAPGAAEFPTPPEL
jgi:Ca2+-binding EF-hand superfamily protein